MRRRRMGSSRLRHRAGAVASALLATVTCSAGLAQPTTPADEPSSARPEERTPGPATEHSWPLVEKTVVRLFSREEAAAFLTTPDEFTEALSPLDRQVRLASADPVSDETFRTATGRAAIDATDDQRADLARLIGRLRERLTVLQPGLFPPEIALIVTDGTEEANAAYTRRTAIVLPRRILGTGPANVERTVLHELFHILSRHRPDLRRTLYRELRFEPIEPITLPPEFADRKLTNPDAPRLDVVFSWITRRETAAAGVPLLYGPDEPYRPENGNLFAILNFRLLLVEKVGDGWQPIRQDGRPGLINPRDLPDYFRAVGRNTGYILHPEEVLADNFVILLAGPSDVPDPWVPRRIASHLVRSEHWPPGTTPPQPIPAAGRGVEPEGASEVSPPSERPSPDRPATDADASDLPR